MKYKLEKFSTSDDVGPKRSNVLYFLGNKLPKNIYKFCFNDSKYPMISTADYAYIDSVSSKLIDNIIRKEKGYITENLKNEMIGPLGGYAIGNALGDFLTIKGKDTVNVNYFFKGTLKVYLYKKKVSDTNCQGILVNRPEYLYFREKENVCKFVFGIVY